MIVRVQNRVRVASSYESLSFILSSKFKTSPVSLQDRKQPDVCEKYFHDVPFEAHFASDMPELQPMSAMPGVDGFTMKVDALYKVCETDGASSAFLCFMADEFYYVCSFT